MNCLNKRIKVKFDATHKKEIKIGDIILLRPDEWMQRDDDGNIKYDPETGAVKWLENTNYLETKPQICTVLEANSKYPYKVGDRLFTHYMAYETAELGDIVTQEGFIIADYVFFTFMPDGSYNMAKEVHFAEQIYSDELKTPGGIILVDKRAELCQVRLTHLPEESPFKIGEVVVTIDSYNYPLEIDGRKLIMLREHEIVGKVIHAAEKEVIA